MAAELVRFIGTSLQAVGRAAELLAYSALFFAFIALLVKGRGAVAAARRAAGEVRINLSLQVINVILFAPIVGMSVTLWRGVVKHYSLALVDERVWSHLGSFGILAAVLFAGDFLGYWRHRFQHTRWFWPAHAVHHSDTQMTWVTLERFHPIDNFTTDCFDFGCLALLGFPDWALVANAIVRHYYGEFIHADLPWMYGPLRRVFVSPVMHRWHHARDVVGAGSNFATVFSVFDQTFGTFYVPGLCNVPLGVTDEMGKGTIRQLIFPLVAWTGEIRARWSRPRLDPVQSAAVEPSVIVTSSPPPDRV